MQEQLNSGKWYTILCTWNNYVTDFVFHHRFIGIHSEAFGADKREEDCTCNGFCDSDDKEPEDVEDDYAEEVGLWRARPERGGASNKYTFRTDLQLDLRKSCFHKVLRVQNACNFASFRNYALAEILRSGKFSQLWFSKRLLLALKL